MSAAKVSGSAISKKSVLSAPTIDEIEILSTSDAPVTDAKAEKKAKKGKATNTRKSKVADAVVESEEDDDDNPSEDVEPAPAKGKRIKPATKKGSKNKKSSVLSLALDIVSDAEADLRDTAERASKPAKASLEKSASTLDRSTRKVSEADTTMDPALESREKTGKVLKTRTSAAKIPSNSKLAKKGMVASEEMRNMAPSTQEILMHESYSEQSASEEADANHMTADKDDIPTPRAKASSRLLASSADNASSQTQDPIPAKAKAKASAKATSGGAAKGNRARTRSQSQSSVASVESVENVPAHEGINMRSYSVEENQEIDTSPAANKKQALISTGQDGKYKEIGEKTVYEQEQDQQDEEMEVLANPKPEQDLISKCTNSVLVPPPARPVRSLPKRISSPLQKDQSQPALLESTLSLSVSTGRPTDFPRTEAFPGPKPDIFATSAKSTARPAISRSQSALDALLAAPMPNFDSPEKGFDHQASPLSSGSVSEIATPPAHGLTSFTSSNVSGPLHLTALSLSESNMPLVNWVQMLCDKEVARVELEASQYLNQWDKQVAAGRQEVRALSRSWISFI